MGSSAHMDWDWQNWFSTNVNLTPPAHQNYFKPYMQPSDVILKGVAQAMQESSDFIWEVAEIAFLQRFAEDEPELFEEIISSNRLFIVGGGITSPDDLLPHGESL